MPPPLTQIQVKSDRFLFGKSPSGKLNTSSNSNKRRRDNSNSYGNNYNQENMYNSNQPFQFGGQNDSYGFSWKYYNNINDNIPIDQQQHQQPRSSYSSNIDWNIGLQQDNNNYYNSHHYNHFGEQNEFYYDSNTGKRKRVDGHGQNSNYGGPAYRPTYDETAPQRLHKYVRSELTFDLEQHLLPRYTVSVRIKGRKYFGIGCSRRAAECRASSYALKVLHSKTFRYKK